MPIRSMFENDLRAEQETIKSYSQRFRQAERAGEFALRNIKRYYHTGAGSRNRSERRHSGYDENGEMSINTGV
jgi:hypothetical protein